MHICIYFSRHKTAQYLPAFLRKITKLQHMVPRSFMTKGPVLAYFSSFASGHASSLHSMVQPHCNFVGSSNAPHTLFLPWIIPLHRLLSLTRTWSMSHSTLPAYTTHFFWFQLRSLPLDSFPWYAWLHSGACLYAPTALGTSPTIAIISFYSNDLSILLNAKFYLVHPLCL